MDISQKVAWLIHVYDMALLGVSLTVSDEFLKTKFLASTIEKYPTSFSGRVTNATLRLTYQEFQKISQNSTKAYPSFEAEYLSTVEGFTQFQKNMLEVSKKLPQKVEAKEYLQFLTTLKTEP